MLSEKELRRHRELSELNSHLTDILRVAAQEKKTAWEVCAVISQMIDSFQNWRIKNERDIQEYRRREEKTYGIDTDDPHLFI